MINLLAILACVGVLIHALVQRLRGVTGISIPLILSCSIVGASVLQAMVEFGENPRYSIPTQSLTVTLVLLVLWNIRARYVARRAQFAG